MISLSFGHGGSVNTAILIFIFTSVLSVLSATCFSATTRGFEARYMPYVARAAADVLIDPALLEAVITNESAWRANAVSPKGAIGLMQLMPQTARNWGVRDPYDPKQNIMGGAKHLKYLIDLFDRNIPLALAAYHAGERRVMKTEQIPDIKETQLYVRAVLDTYHDLTERQARAFSFSGR